MLAYIFDQEYRSPADLWAKIFHRKLGAIGDASTSKGSFIHQSLLIIFQRQLLPFDIELLYRCQSTRNLVALAKTHFREFCRNSCLHIADRYRVSTLVRDLYSSRQALQQRGPSSRRHSNDDHNVLSDRLCSVGPDELVVETKRASRATSKSRTRFDASRSRHLNRLSRVAIRLIDASSASCESRLCR